MQKVKRSILWIVVAANLMLGLYLYLTFRQDTYISKFIFRIFSLNPSVFSAITLPLPDWLIIFCRNYACDILWASALTITIFLLSAPGANQMPITCITSVLFEILMECLQLSRFFTGTFDLLDIAFEIVASAVILLLIKRKEEQS